MLQNQQAEGRFLWFPGGIRRSLGEIANGAHKRKNCFLTAKALCVIIYLQNLRRRAPLEAEIQPLWFRFCPALCAATLAGSDDGSHHHLSLFSFIWDHCGVQKL